MSQKKRTKRARRRSQFAELKNKNRVPRKTGVLDSEIKQIEEHGFYKSIIEYSLIPVWKEYQKAEKEKREFVLTNEQGYHADVFYYAGALFEGISRPIA